MLLEHFGHVFAWTYTFISLGYFIILTFWFLIMRYLVLLDRAAFPLLLHGPGRMRSGHLYALISGPCSQSVLFWVRCEALTWPMRFTWMSTQNKIAKLAETIVRRPLLTKINQKEGKVLLLYFVLITSSPCHESSKRCIGTVCRSSRFLLRLVLSVSKVYKWHKTNMSGSQDRRY